MLAALLHRTGRLEWDCKKLGQAAFIEHSRRGPAWLDCLPSSYGVGQASPGLGFVSACTGAVHAGMQKPADDALNQASESAHSPPRRLRVEAPADLERAVLQSASASIALPDLELALSSGGEGGLATTVGELISSVRSAASPFCGGHTAAALAGNREGQRAGHKRVAMCKGAPAAGSPGASRINQVACLLFMPLLARSPWRS